MSEQNEVLPKGGFKVKIKDGSGNAYYLTSDRNALGAFPDQGHTFTVCTTATTLTIEAGDGQYAGVTAKPEFAPVSSNYTWDYTSKDGNSYSGVHLKVGTNNYYWTIVPRDGVNYIVPSTDWTKGWTLELEPIPQP